MTAFQARLVPFGSQAILPIEITCVGKLVDQDSIDISFQLTGSLENILFDPPQENHKRTDNLWQKTCFELFVKNDIDSNYWEYNLSPSGNWAIYAFESYRKGKFDELSIQGIPITTRQETNQFTLNSYITLPDKLSRQNLKIGLTTVVQDTNGDIYYYALKHTEKQPDFHVADSFTINITS